MNNLTYKEIFIISKYFENDEDYINLVKTKKDYNILDLYRYNPIELTDKNIKLFKNIEYYHIYKKESLNYLENINIKNIIVWARINYSKAFLKNIINYKRLILKEPIIPIPKNVYAISKYRYLSEKEVPETMIIPDNVYELKYSCFRYCDGIKI